MSMRMHPSILVMGKMVGIALVQITMSILLYRYYVNDFKSDISFWFSLLFPLFFGLISNFLSLRNVNKNRILRNTIIWVAAIFIEYIAFLICTTIFGE